jgi:hypothetical protein
VDPRVFRIHSGISRIAELSMFHVATEKRGIKPERSESFDGIMLKGRSGARAEGRQTKKIKLDELSS